MPSSRRSYRKSPTRDHESISVATKMSECITTSNKLNPAAALLWHPPGDKIAFLDEFPFPRLRSPILDATLACRHSFRTICFASHKKSKWAEENLISFNAWSVSSGAGVWGEFSLDDKLVTRRQDSCILRNLLWMLNDFVNAVGRIGAPAEESNIQGAESVLRQLFTITTDLLRSLPFTHLWDSDSPFGNEADEDAVLFKSTLLSEYDPLPANADRSRVQSINAVRDRLLEANSKRRSRLQNAKKRKTDSRSGTSHQSSQGQGLYPVLPPPVAAGSKVFECPHCFENLPAYLARAGHWREHVMADLAPFSCVVSECQHPNLFFTSEFTWRSHMERVHGVQRWTCYYCDPSISFDSLEALRKHLKAQRADKVHAAALKLEDSVILSETASWHIDKPLECPFCPELALGDRALDHIANCLLGFAMKALLYDEKDFHRASTGALVPSIELSDAVGSTDFTVPVENTAVPIDLLGTEGQPVPYRPQAISPIPQTPTRSKQPSTARSPRRQYHHSRHSAARTIPSLALSQASPRALGQGVALSPEQATMGDGPPTKRRKPSEDDLPAFVLKQQSPEPWISNTSSVLVTVNGSGLSGPTGRTMASGNTTMRTLWVQQWDSEILPWEGWASCYTGERHHERRSKFAVELFQRVGEGNAT